MKKFLIGAINVLSIIIIIFAVVVLGTVVMNRDGVPNIMGYSVLRVLTGSMEPAIKTDSLIVIKQVDQFTIEEGDVISFYSLDPSLYGAVNTHRVVEKECDKSGCVFTTKGDNNLIKDEFPAMGANVIGKVVMTSAFLGVVVHLLSNPLIFVPLIAVPLVIMIIVNFMDAIKSAKQLAEEEEKKALKEALEELKKQKAALQEKEETKEEE